MSQEPTTRIIVTLPESLIEAIDEWRYANKVPSRTEAVRRLLLKGLLADHRKKSAR